jgi:hypothetical protein
MRWDRRTRDKPVTCPTKENKPNIRLRLETDCEKNSPFFDFLSVLREEFLQRLPWPKLSLSVLCYERTHCTRSTQILSTTYPAVAQHGVEKEKRAGRNYRSNFFGLAHNLLTPFPTAVSPITLPTKKCCINYSTRKSTKTNSAHKIICPTSSCSRSTTPELSRPARAPG